MNPTDPLRHRLLIVDDNPQIHEDIRKILCPERQNSQLQDAEAALFGTEVQATAFAEFEIDSAYQGQEGLAKVEAALAEGRPYTLAFVDVRMPPGWDGIETIRRVWDRYRELQVVICTAYSDHSWEDIIRSLGHSDSLVILKKPFDNVEVLQLAHALTKKWLLAREASSRMNNLDAMVRARTDELLQANQRLQAEVTRRSEIESALRSSEERFQKAFLAATVPMAILHRRTQKCMDANNSFTALTGRSRGEVVGHTLLEIELPASSDDWSRVLSLMENGQAVRDQTCFIRLPNADTRETLVSLEPVVMGQEECLLLAIRDVTEQRQLESHIRQTQKMEAIGQLAAGIAHDFNNLLTIIHGHASLQMNRAGLDKQVTYSLGQVRLAADRAAALTKQLLAFSRRQVVQRKPLDLVALINRVLPMLSRITGENIALKHSCASNLPNVFADESSLEQVIMNLVVNARDATPANGTVTIHAEPVTVDEGLARQIPDARPGTFVCLSVTDTGSGIDPAILPRLFEPFFTTKPAGKGTGLGLSTVYGIARQHEGWVQVESQMQAGSTFRVFIPVSQEAVTAESETSFLPSQTGSEAPRATVLLVEDETPLREFVSVSLEKYGYRVLQAADGVEAQKVWQNAPHRIDLLVTDMVMPNGVNGAMLASRLHHQRADLKVLYISGYSPDVVGNADRLVEGVNFLPKPFTIPKLVKAAERCLHSQDTMLLTEG